MSKPISVAFKEVGVDSTVKAFDRVGNSAVSMSKQVDRSSDSHKLLSARVGETEGRFMGMADLLDGIGTAFGLPIDGAINMARAAGDVTGGLSNLSGIVPAVASKFPMLAGGMTLISAHPIMTAFLVGGAIIGGLILLEKKFGIVSDAVRGLGGVFSGLWGIIKPSLNFILGGVEAFINVISAPMRLLSKLPGIPDLPTVRLPRLDVGGTVLQTGIAVVHRGEVVSPAAGPFSPGAGGTSVVVIVNGSVNTEAELVDAIHEGLMRKQGRSGNLGFKAA